MKFSLFMCALTASCSLSAAEGYNDDDAVNPADIAFLRSLGLPSEQDQENQSSTVALSMSIAMTSSASISSVASASSLANSPAPSSLSSNSSTPPALREPTQQSSSLPE